MTQVTQELMPPHETARWFRRSPSWLRQQHDLLPVRSAGGQPLYHVRVCRAYVLGCLCGLTGPELRQAQIKALASACGLAETELLLARPAMPEAEHSPESSACPTAA